MSPSAHTVSLSWGPQSDRAAGLSGNAIPIGYSPSIYIYIYIYLLFYLYNIEPPPNFNL